jgi:hypothetical protein
MWYYLTIDDPDLLSGKSFHRLISRAIKLIPCSEIMMDGLQVVSATPPRVQASDGKWPVLSPDELQEFMLSLTQVVWGTFYFFSHRGDARDANRHGSFQELVESTAFTICAHDNTWYEVYCRSTELVCDLVADNWRIKLLKDESPRFWTSGLLSR